MKVIILCGGMGTRLREETEYKPKPMVEVGGKPILWHIMKIYAHYGYKEFVIALGYKGDYIRNYFLNYQAFNNDFTINLGNHNELEIFGKHEESDWKVTLVETGATNMTGSRVKQCGRYITEDSFMLTYGDAVANVPIDKLIEFHKQAGTIGTVTGVFPPSRFGELQTNGNIVERFKEKPKHLEGREPINGGFFVFKKEFLDFIPDNDPTVDLEKAPLESLTNSGQLSVYRHSDFWQCMDTFRDNQYLNELWANEPVWKVW